MARATTASTAARARLVACSGELLPRLAGRWTSPSSGADDVLGAVARCARESKAGWSVAALWSSHEPSRSLQIGVLRGDERSAAVVAQPVVRAHVEGELTAAYALAELTIVDRVSHEARQLTGLRVLIFDAAAGTLELFAGLRVAPAVGRHAGCGQPARPSPRRPRR